MNKKISEFTEETTVPTEGYFPFVDESGTPKVDKKISKANLIEELGGGSYKRYVATLTQSGTSAPVATVLENTLGGTVVWSRLTNGVYYATLTGVMTQNKTFVSSDLRANSDLFVTSGWDTVNRVIVGTIASTTGTATDFGNHILSIEIRVYP